MKGSSGRKWKMKKNSLHVLEGRISIFEKRAVWTVDTFHHQYTTMWSFLEPFVVSSLLIVDGKRPRLREKWVFFFLFTPKKKHTFPLTRSFFILFQHNTPAHWLQRWRSSAHILALCPLLLRRFCVDGGHVQGWATQRYARRQDWHTCYFLKDPVAPTTRNTALR